MKIYTKTGDKGTTSLVGGERVAKNSFRIEAYGDIDELMAHIGYLHDSMLEELDLSTDRMDLLTILDHLMSLSAHLATPDGVTKGLPLFDQSRVAFLEGRIDEIMKSLTPADKFTMPCGHILISICHICRTVCRRSERAVLSLGKEASISDLALVYLNRLSDYLYVLGRKFADEFNVVEHYWLPQK